MLAILGTFLVRSGILDSIHAFGASTLGVPFVTLIAVMIAGSIALVVSRRDALRSEHRLDSLLSREAIFLGNNLVLVGLCFVVFWGTFFPLIAEAVTGEQAVGRPAVVRPLHGAARARARAAVGHRAGDRVAPGDGGQPAAQLPVADRRGAPSRSSSLARARASTGSATGADHVRRRRVRDRASSPRSSGAARPRGGRWPARARRCAVVRSCGATAAATAATSSTSGWRCCSSASPRRRRSRTTRDVQPAPGRPRRRSAATTSATCARRARIDERDGRAREDLLRRRARRPPRRRAGRHAAPRARLLPVDGRAGLGPVGRFFEGEATSEIGLQAGLTRDLWTAMSPDIGKLRPIIDRGDEVFARAEGKIPPAMEAALLGRAITGLVDRYRERPAAGDVPPHRLAARRVDLDRRAHRLRRRADRAVAGARGRAPRERGARGAAGARPRPPPDAGVRVTASWTCSPR